MGVVYARARGHCGGVGRAPWPAAGRTWRERAVPFAARGAMEAPSQFLAENGDGDMGTGLSEEQCAAVLAPEGPVRVVAGPGSGKTRVLALRVAHLVKNENLAPWSALCITFTRKAAGELKERLAAFLGAERARRVWAGTFHAVCARILRHEVENRLPESGRTASFAIFGPDEQLFVTTMQPLGPALEIQWSLDGAPIPGANGPTLDLGIGKQCGHSQTICG